MSAANESDLPSYAVRIAPTAGAQAAAQYDWLKANYGAGRADQWRQELYTAWGSLATLPLRCSTAPEDTEFQQFRPGPSLRAFRYQKGRQSYPWRILFTVHEATLEDAAFVQVHRLHQSMQPPLDWPIEEA